MSALRIVAIGAYTLLSSTTPTQAEGSAFNMPPGSAGSRAYVSGLAAQYRCITLRLGRLPAITTCMPAIQLVALKAETTRAVPWHRFHSKAFAVWETPILFNLAISCSWAP